MPISPIVRLCFREPMTLTIQFSEPADLIRHYPNLFPNSSQRCLSSSSSSLSSSAYGCNLPFFTNDSCSICTLNTSLLIYILGYLEKTQLQVCKKTPSCRFVTTHKCLQTFSYAPPIPHIKKTE